MRRIFIVALAAAIFGLLVTWLGSRPAASSTTGAKEAPSASAAPAAVSSPPPAAPATTLPLSAPPAASAAERVRWLLTVPAGQVSALDVAHALAALQAGGDAARAEARALCAAATLAERLLGFRLRLELEGTSQELLDESARDAEPLVLAEVLHGAYRAGLFDVWSGYLDRYARSLGVESRAALLGLVASDPPQPELPAALVLLNVGRGGPRLLRAVLERSAAMAGDAAARLAADDAPETQRKALLDLLADARPREAAAAALALLDSPAPRPLRLQAARALGRLDPEPAGFKPLHERAEKEEDRELAQALLRSADQQRASAAAGGELAALEALLRGARAKSTLPPDQLDAWLVQYVERSARSPRRPDPGLASAARALLSRQKDDDFARAELVADANYLVWRSAQNP